jgi:hypothetical protein
MSDEVRYEKQAPPKFTGIAAAGVTLYGLDESGKVWVRHSIHGADGCWSRYAWQLDDAPAEVMVP